MEILQKIYKRPEKSWMGVFHAAGISNGENCIVFIGDSGNGKSTLSSILMANGLDVLSDDFLPIEGSSMNVCFFPAAISVKKQGYKILIPDFPELRNTQEYRTDASDKTFRFLTTKEPKSRQIPCKAIVYVKYQEKSGFQFESMSKEEAFQYLVPDSWISPEPENAKKFVEWFLMMPTYRMTYSDNSLMVKEINKMLENEL